jgi:hypothetical protein
MIWEVRLSLASFFLRAACWLGRGCNSGDARWIYCRKPSLNDAAFLIEKREAWSSLLVRLHHNALSSIRAYSSLL